MFDFTFFFGLMVEGGEDKGFVEVEVMLLVQRELYKQSCCTWSAFPVFNIAYAMTYLLCWVISQHITSLY